MRRRRLILIGGLLTAATGLGGLSTFAPTSEPAHGKSAPILGLMETADTTPVRLEVRGHRFGIPRNYFRYPPELDPEAKGGFLLRVLLPDMTPYTAENAREFDTPGFGRRLTILVHNEPEIRPLEEILRFRLGRATLAAPSQGTYGLSHVTTRLGPRDFRHYADVGQERVRSLIECRSPKPHVVTDCDHLFVWDSLTIQVNYGAKHLQQWRATEDRVVNLLESFSRNQEGMEK